MTAPHPVTSAISAPIVRLLVGSAGRRTYLLRWFRESLARFGMRARIAITESDPMAVTAAFADAVHPIPRYEDPDYAAAMTAVFEMEHPDLFLSVNDHELSSLAGPLADKLRGHGGVVPSLDPDRQQLVADKHAMAMAFGAHGISCPPTVLASDRDGVAALAGSSARLVIKERHGSAGSGFQLVRATDIGTALALRHGPSGAPNLDALVVQPFRSGVQYGLDVVADLTDSDCVTGVLARRKDDTRPIGTMRVTTVDAGRFRPLAQRIAGVVRPQGLIDIDLVETDEGGLQVLDVNPRIGGGYPFSHAAGADVPSYLIAELLGLAPPAGWDTYRIGATIGRHDCFTQVN